MAGFPTSNSLPWRKSFEKSLAGLSNNLADKRQRENFITIARLLGLRGEGILQGAGVVSGHLKHWSRALSHFLNHSPCSEFFSHLEQYRLRLVEDKLVPACRLIAIDTVPLCKEGEHFQYQCGVYDPCHDKVHSGFWLLLAVAIDDKAHYAPLGWHRYSSLQPQFKSENIEKLNFIKKQVGVVNQHRTNQRPVIVADSGFCRKNLIQWLTSNNVPFFIRTSKRKVKLASGCRQLTSTLKPGWYSQITVCAWDDIQANLFVGKNKSKQGKPLVILTNLHPNQLTCKR